MISEPFHHLYRLEAEPKLRQPLTRNAFDLLAERDFYVNLHEGIVQTVQWYLQNQPWIDNVTSGEYRKYYQEMYGA